MSFHYRGRANGNRARGDGPRNREGMGRGRYNNLEDEDRFGVNNQYNQYNSLGGGQSPGRIGHDGNNHSVPINGRHHGQSSSHDNFNNGAVAPGVGFEGRAPIRGAVRGDQSGLPPLSNFFNFTSKPIPKIPQIAEALNPMRQTQSNHRRHNDWTSTYKSDENTDYVKRHMKNFEEEAKARARRSATSSRRAERYEESEAEDGLHSEPSVMGTIHTRATRDQVNQDPEVFWKFDMKKRLHETSSLLINQSKDKILAALASRQVVIVEGFTGCGKTTQVPQFILDEAAETGSKCRIVVTQPRRIAAISVAQRVCNERGWQVGGLVGYQVGMSRCMTEDTRLTYVTTGVLLNLLISKKHLKEYTHIIIDEVHERDLDTDLLLLVIKKLMVDRDEKETKIILMSATLNAEKFQSYFPVWGRNESSLHRSTVVRVTQPALHKITEHYIETLASQYGFEGFTMDGSEEPRLTQEATEIACQIIVGLDQFEKAENQLATDASKSERDEYLKKRENDKKEGKDGMRGAVLIFLPGLMEIDLVYKQLQELSMNAAGGSNNVDVYKWNLIPLHSTITNDEQQKVFITAKPGIRKIILATNIAESSITVPDIKYVIDFCLTKSLSCDPATNYTCLRLEWASKNQCIQRRGRCGRVTSGHCFRMVSEVFYEQMYQEALPEMEKASLEAVVLQVKVLAMGSPEQILALAIDPPKLAGIGRAVANLKEVGALTLKVGTKYSKYDGDLTYMGRVMSRLPIDIRLGRFIMLGYVFGILDDAIVIAAGLSTKSPFSYPYTKRLEAYLSKMEWSMRSFSDCFCILNAFNAWGDKHREYAFHSFGDEKNWARTYFLQISVLREIGLLVDEIKKRLQILGIGQEPVKLESSERGLILKLVIAGAFYPNYFLRTRPNKKEYEKEVCREVGGLNPLITVVFQGFPIEQPGRLYAKRIADPLTNKQSIPHVKFQASKVLVMFDPRGDKIGPISHGVYRALKMRMLRHKITFFTHGREDSQTELTAALSELEIHGIKHLPKAAKLPVIQESEIHCFIAHMDTPGDFWVIRAEDEETVATIKDIISESTESLRAIDSNELMVGGLAIILKDNERMRARMDCIRDDKKDVLLFLIDWGISVWRPMNQVYRLSKFMESKRLSSFRGLAMQCKLSEIKPSTRNASVWPPEAKETFAEFVANSNNRFILRIYSIVDSVIAGQIYSLELKKTINEILIEKGYGDPAPEPRASVENHDARRLWKPLRYDEKKCEALNEAQETGWMPQRMVEPPEIDEETGCLIALRGPNSPLEMNFSSQCRSAHLKNVQIEGNSVNCVALDQEPFIPCARMLVSANVGIAHRSGNLMARETTLMPAIPGLTALLTMLFCPQLEFRVDDQVTKYTGCVSGLGLDERAGLAVYPDHDMEVIFDTKIDSQDIHRINSIRMTLNILLRDSQTGPREAENLRERVRTEVIELLERDRDSIEEVWPDYPHLWGQIPSTVTMEEEDGIERYAHDVFPLHREVRFEPVDPENFEFPIPRNVFQYPKPPPF